MTDVVYRLFIGKKFSGISVEPDDVWPEMWRVRQGDRLSGMLNLTRAREVGRVCALRATKSQSFGNALVKWIRSETPRSDVPIEFSVGAYGEVAARRQNAAMDSLRAQLTAKRWR